MIRVLRKSPKYIIAHGCHEVLDRINILGGHLSDATGGALKLCGLIKLKCTYLFMCTAIDLKKDSLFV
jgi:hypothetical protein